jgi:hypothetical protein
VSQLIEQRLVIRRYRLSSLQSKNSLTDILIFATDWLSTEIIIRRLMYAKEAFHKYKIKDQIDVHIHEKIINNNFDNPDKILKIVQKLKVMRKNI